jgi:hypothetical protein
LPYENCGRLKILIFLSMSYLLGLLEELQSFLEILLLFTIVLRKGAKVISGTNGIKKEIKIVLNVFVIKQKIEELKEIGIMHSKTNMNDIPKLM